MAREHLIDLARGVYRSFGYRPIDTPALEYSEILLGKGGMESDKQMFRFIDQGDRDVAMRFDLTVPFARFSAQHLQEIGLPFKRYHIGTVWRAERPQKGRYREFMQCDFDTIGTTDNAADIETMLVIHDLMVAIGFEQFTIRVNNRLVLNGLLQKFDLLEKSADVLRVLDKLPKVGRAAVIAEMTDAAVMTSQQAEQVLTFAETTGSPEEILTELQSLLTGNETGERGIANLRSLFDTAHAVGLPAGRLALDLSIARGLDYYTGTIYETFLTQLPTIGSVCSGGRYDNLAELFTTRQLPGVGASLGLDRLLAAMQELEMLSTTATPAAVLITVMDAERLPEYFALGRLLRQGGIAAEVYPEAKALGKQLKYADRQGFRIAVIAGETEFNNGQWQLKDLQAGTQERVSATEMLSTLDSILTRKTV